MKMHLFHKVFFLKGPQNDGFARMPQGGFGFLGFG